MRPNPGVAVVCGLGEHPGGAPVSAFLSRARLPGWRPGQQQHPSADTPARRVSSPGVFSFSPSRAVQSVPERSRPPRRCCGGRCVGLALSIRLRVSASFWAAALSPAPKSTLVSFQASYRGRRSARSSGYRSRRRITCLMLPAIARELSWPGSRRGSSLLPTRMFWSAVARAASRYAGGVSGAADLL